MKSEAIEEEVVQSLRNITSLNTIDDNKIFIFHCLFETADLRFASLPKATQLAMIDSIQIQE